MSFPLMEEEKMIKGSSGVRRLNTPSECWVVIMSDYSYPVIKESTVSHFTSGFKGIDDENIIELVLSLCLAPEESRRLAQVCLK